MLNFTNANLEKSVFIEQSRVETAVRWARDTAFCCRWCSGLGWAAPDGRLCSPPSKSAGWGFPGFCGQGGLLSVVCISLLVAVFDLWPLSVLNRAKRPNGFLHSGPPGAGQGRLPGMDMAVFEFSLSPYC